MIKPFTTTLTRIRTAKPCQDRWKRLLKHLGKTQADDEPLPFAVILESNGLDDALWCCRTAPEYDKEWRLYFGAIAGEAWSANTVMAVIRSAAWNAANKAGGGTWSETWEKAWAAAREKHAAKLLEVVNG